MKNTKALKNSIVISRQASRVISLYFRGYPTNYTENPTNYTEKPTNYTEDLENYGVMVALIGGQKSVNIYKEI